MAFVIEAVASWTNGNLIGARGYESVQHHKAKAKQPRGKECHSTRQKGEATRQSENL